MLRKFIEYIFFGNFFYGIIAVMLAIEANLQQNIPLNSLSFYTTFFSGTVIYYILAYIEEADAAYNNKRNTWYAVNKKLIRNSITVLIFTCIISAAYFTSQNFHHYSVISLPQLIPLILTGITALAYYSFSFWGHQFSTRNTGLLKPFFIGMVWAVSVTYIPVLAYELESNQHYVFSQLNLWFLIKNFMFISILAILFDIKDYAADHNRKLKTFVVRMGLRKTIFRVIIPLAAAGWASLIVFASIMHFPLLRIAINSIPFLLLLQVAWSMQKRRSILYYLIIIDGLMLAKAVCGISAYYLVNG